MRGMLLVILAAALGPAPARAASVQSRSVSWSADGTRLLAAGGKDLLLFDADGKRVASLTAPAEVLSAALSPDGRRAAYTLATGEIWAWDSATGASAKVCAPASRQHMCVDAQWSPGGARLSYGVLETRAMTKLFDDPVKRYTLMVAQADGSGAKSLVVYEQGN